VTTFKKGKSGNPDGRPKGARNKATLIIEKLLDDDAETIGKKAIELAKAGDSTALRLCLDRIAPARRDRHVAFALPPMNAPADAVGAVAAIVAAVAGGELTPSEAAELTKLVESYTRILESADHEERLRKLEGLLNGDKSRTTS
jgi:hypothetical protein